MSMSLCRLSKEPPYSSDLRSITAFSGLCPLCTHCRHPAVSYTDAMELHGTILNNLTSAVQSARRLRGHPVHADTLGHWAELLTHARRAVANGSTEPILPLVLDLEKEIADRGT